MIFIGSGALLSRAVLHAKSKGLVIDLVCCPPGDSAVVILKRSGVRFLQTKTPNADLSEMLTLSSDRIAFSVNNATIIGDHLLGCGVSFFNIHNGLVQNYRGLPEVCIFAALCKAEPVYGVTLHRILPADKVDSGPVIAQRQFEVAANDGFANVMSKALDACRTIFEDNVGKVAVGDYEPRKVTLAANAYSYKHVVDLCNEAHPDRLAKASDFREYETAFPRLAKLVTSERREPSCGRISLPP